MALEPGDKAPDFTLPDQHGDPVSLSGLHGKTVVLSFYPKADTPRCTTQACGPATTAPTTRTWSGLVLGVSPDPVKPIAKFDEKFGLDFRSSPTPMTRSPRPSACGPRRSSTAAPMGNERTTFVIREDGTIREVFRNVKPAEHDELVLGALAGS